MSQERTRFPITPQERHETAKSFDEVEAVPEENRPRNERQPQDKPPPRDAAESDQDKPRPADDRDDPDERAS